MNQKSSLLNYKPFVSRALMADIRNNNQVRLDAGMLEAEHGARPAKAGLNFIGDQYDPVMFRKRAQLQQEFDRGSQEAAIPLNRLDDDCKRHDPVRSR